MSKFWIQKEKDGNGIVFIQDIHNGWTWRSIQEIKYEKGLRIKGDTRDKLIEAIPEEFKFIMKKPKELGYPIMPQQLQLGECKLNGKQLFKCTPKQFRRKEDSHVPAATRNWNQEWERDWKRGWKQLRLVTNRREKDTVFLLMHRALHACENIERIQKLKRVCECGKPESFDHTFAECPQIRGNWEELKRELGVTIGRREVQSNTTCHISFATSPIENFFLPIRAKGAL